MCRERPSSWQDSSMPGSRVRRIRVPAAARASAWPATVSWSVSATTSRPARAARRITSAGGSVPSEALLCTCRSARTPSSGEPRGGGPERQVQLLTRIPQVAQHYRLDQEDTGGVRPQHDPEPQALHLAREYRAVRRSYLPERKIMITERGCRYRWNRSE